MQRQLPVLQLAEIAPYPRAAGGKESIPAVGLPYSFHVPGPGLDRGKLVAYAEPGSDSPLRSPMG